MILFLLNPVVHVSLITYILCFVLLFDQQINSSHMTRLLNLLSKNETAGKTSTGLNKEM